MRMEQNIYKFRYLLMKIVCWIHRDRLKSRFFPRLFNEIHDFFRQGFVKFTIFSHDLFAKFATFFPQSFREVHDLFSTIVSQKIWFSSTILWRNLLVCFARFWRNLFFCDQLTKFAIFSHDRLIKVYEVFFWQIDKISDHCLRDNFDEIQHISPQSFTDNCDLLLKLMLFLRNLLTKYASFLCVRWANLIFIASN